MPVGGVLRWNARELDQLLNGENGPVARDLQRRGEIGAQAAKRLCSVSPAGSNGRGSGYTRSSIGWDLGRDGRGLYVDVRATAKTPDGIPIGLLLELGTRAHEIASHGNYPLRNRRTGQVFGRKVQHPGTRPRPFLRPALVEMVRA
ncbi:hypothetical protein [Actinomadura opuntiae]|uniref:hypothetical protein n=1 Tax=Actinomadura sp. OS1-43 TaxID=604315 RepID=UPI00255B2B6B|nr:hypothetical protein [Actinomadura sp. OS1-43]MDL4812817.1 hypothetical protein [Actinomadura sp. OS1-43]